ncbi:hypothetical protein E5K00_13300 [Hymenobacter aquaticus]|uniref:Carboxypeptidase-like regulatory domain-containing protein n=2 Tax=Hymenobacter aquaticus TaxID=1867101 RepID=A0A4Z0Q029_9BACT|nr:hypothetical protein E5K00_13300 [Hymenobacter aquaticus]
MTPQGAGRHCAACQKVVVDFTQKTDAEILAVLAQAAGAACGRFGASQLGRVLQPLPAPQGAAWWQTALAATVALFSFRALAPDAARGQQLRVHPWYSRHSSEPEFKPTGKDKLAEVALNSEKADSAVVTGRVLDKTTGDGLPGVAVLIKGTTHYAFTDSDGNFSLPVANDERRLPLTFKQLGYLGIEIPQPAQPFVEVKMEVETMGYLAPYTPKGIWQRLSLIPWRVKNALHRE